jgi:hypothetical protein
LTGHREVSETERFFFFPGRMNIAHTSLKPGHPFYCLYNSKTFKPVFKRVITIRKREARGNCLLHVLVDQRVVNLKHLKINPARPKFGLVHMLLIEEYSPCDNKSSILLFSNIKCKENVVWYAFLAPGVDFRQIYHK